MSLDFTGPATIGQWVEGTARVLRHTKHYGFVDCLFTAEGEPALRANAVFQRKFERTPVSALIASKAMSGATQD